MKYCSKCGNMVQETDRACGQCGTVIDQSVIPGGTRVRTPTVVEGSPSATPAASRSDYRPTPPPPRSISGQMPMPSSPPGTISAAASPPTATLGPARRGKTVYMPAGGQEGAAQIGPAAPARRVLAVLVTYSWKPEGQVFPIREGRNLIGRGEECEVCLPEDTSLSQVNTHITYRQNFTIGDAVSMNGTDLNGQPVEEQYRTLTNLSLIRAGSTQFIFVVVDPLLLQIGI